MLAVILCSVLIGAILAIVAQALLLRKWFFSLPVTGPPRRPQFDKFSLPKEIQDALLDPDLKKKTETCLCLNLIFQFLFNELKDTKQARRWVTKRMNNEFAEMLQTTTGRLLDQITVRDFNLGETFPIVKHASVDNVEYRTDTQSLDEVSLLVDLVYNGGFQLAVDVDLVFGKSAYLYVKVNKLKGTARLRYSRKPFTHWTFTFVEDPLLELQVESQFEGRQLSQITSLITNMIRRSVRKKHTLPNYKIRYRPFFTKPENKPPPQDVFMHGSKLSTGILKVTVVECSRLVKTSPDSFIYCTVAIDSLPWNEMMSSKRKQWVMHDVEITKQASPSIGLTFKEEFIHEKLEDMVMVETVTPGSPAAISDIRKNDLVTAVGSTKVTSCKQAAKLMKQSPEKFTVRIERLTSVKAQEHEIKFEEDNVSLKDGDHAPPAEQMNVDEDEEYVNITVIDGAGDRSRDNTNPPRDGSIEKTLSDTGSLSDEKNSQSSNSKKGISSLLSNSSGLFHRKRGRDNSRSPRASPEPRRKVLETKESSGNSSKGGPSLDAPSEEIRKRRTVSDVTPLLLDKSNKDKSDTGSLKDVNLDCASTTSSSSHTTSKGSTAGSASKSNTTTPAASSTSIPSSVSKSTASTEEEEEDIDLRKTELIKGSQDLVFDETFEFEVDDSHAYLNACVWCRIPEKLDKQNRVIKPEKDIPLGHVSVSLMDVTLDCMSTIQGDTKHTYKLTPAEIKATASRSKIASHPGFEERLCYGDIVLGFEHVSQPLSAKDRQHIQKVREENELTLEKQLQDQPVYASKRILEEGKHDFIGTHFQSSTYCDFCHKKIWLKVAFQCRICGMICHKKCTQRCQEQTVCNKGGYQVKNRPPEAGTQPLAASKKAAGKEETSAAPAGKENNNSAQQKSSFLSKFRNKDAPRVPLRESAKGIIQSRLLRRSHSPSPTVEGIRRHNSAPNTSESEEDVAAAAAAAAASLLSTKKEVPRTRSSTCLEDLVQENASPKLQPPELQNVKNGTSISPDSSPNSTDTEDEEEMNLLKFFERPRSGHNADEMVVTAAKEMGKELYMSLGPEERRVKLDAMVSKFQMEIDIESENRAELARMERETSDPSRKASIKKKVAKSDERIQSLAILMLHYCAGLQNCLDSQEQVRLDEEEKKLHFENGMPTETASEGNQVEIPKIVTEEPSTHGSSDSDSCDEPIYIKASDSTSEQYTNTDSIS